MGFSPTGKSENKGKVPSTEEHEKVQEVNHMEKRRSRKELQPNIAPGSEDLEKKATPEEIARGGLHAGHSFVL
jgi:hypothetical protein